MQKDKLEKIKASILKVIDLLDAADVLGPIGYLEDCLVSLDAAIDEIELYYDEEDDAN